MKITTVCNGDFVPLSASEKPSKDDCVVVPQFWRNLFPDYYTCDGSVEDLTKDLTDDLKLVLSTFEDIPEPEVLKFDVYRFELEGYRRILKSEISELKEKLKLSDNKVNLAHLDFLIAKYKFFEIVILEEFSDVYNRYMKICLAGKTVDDSGFSLLDYEQKLLDLYSLLMEKDKETIIFVKSLIEKALNLLRANEYYKERIEELSFVNSKLLENVDVLERKVLVFDESHDEDMLVYEENSGLAKNPSIDSSSDYQKSLEFEILRLNEQLEYLRVQMEYLRVQNALYDEGSKMSAQELQNYRKRAEEGNRAVKKLSEESKVFEQYLSDYSKIQFEHRELLESYQRIFDEKEALEEQLLEKSAKLDFFTSEKGESLVSQNELLDLQKKLKQYEYQIADYKRHIDSLTNQLATLERTSTMKISDMIKDLSIKLTIVASGVEEIRQRVVESTATPANDFNAIED